MSSFKGLYKYSLDSKGRINIPAKFRKAISPEANDTFVITRGLDGCLFAYPLDEWQKIEKKLRLLSMTIEAHRLFVRILTSYATEAVYDKQGRVQIPSYLAESAKIDRDVVIIGALDRIEIWSPKAYEEYVMSHTDTFESIVEKIILNDDKINE